MRVQQMEGMAFMERTVPTAQKASRACTAAAQMPEPRLSTSEFPAYCQQWQRVVNMIRSKKKKLPRLASYVRISHTLLRKRLRLRAPIWWDNGL